MDFIQTNSFATIISSKENKPIATHLPLQIRKMKDEYYLTVHFAYGNPQWKAYKSKNQVLVIFQGPHSYVSSSWYSHGNVPT